MAVENTELTAVKSEMKSINDLLIRANTKLNILIDDFRSHKLDDDKHFNRIYESVNNVPDRMAKCKESLKTEVMAISRREFATVTDFKEFKATVKTAVIVGVTVGSGIGTVIVGAFTLILKFTGVI